MLHCPSCQKRLKFDLARFAGKRLSLRCPACQQTFDYRVPPGPPAAEEDPFPPLSSPVAAEGDEITSPPISQEPPEVTETTLPVKAGRVLVAVEDKGAAEKAAKTLSEVFEQVETVSDAQQTLVVMGMDPPELLVLSTTLPGMASHELVDRLHARAEMDQVPVVLLTGLKQKWAYGADAHVDVAHLNDLGDTAQQLLAARQAAMVDGSAPLDEEEMRTRILAEVESFGRAIDGRTEADVWALARLIVSHIIRVERPCFDNPWANLDCLERVRAELAVGRQVLRQLLPEVRTHTTDYVRVAFESFMRQRALERSGAYAPGLDHSGL